MMHAKTGKDICPTQISSDHERYARAVHRAHKLQLFLKKPLPEDYVLRRAITCEEVLLRTPPLLFGLWNVFQALIIVAAQVVNECLRPLEFKRGHLPRLISYEGNKDSPGLLLIVGVEHTLTASRDAARKLSRVSHRFGRSFLLKQFCFDG